MLSWELVLLLWAMRVCSRGVFCMFGLNNVRICTFFTALERTNHVTLLMYPLSHLELFGL